MPRLEAVDIVMQFPAVRALDGVTLSFEPGEVHGIIGENGAGKSTLMKILAGIQVPTSGTIRGPEHTPLSLRSVGDALRAGIAMIHQELNLVDTLTAAENIFLGRESTKLGFLDRSQMELRAAEYLSQVGAEFAPRTMVGDLSIAGKQLVEIAKALSYNASVLIMDEPTAVLSERETASLFALIRQLRANGVCVIYISHRLAEVEEICDRISVLRDGRLVASVLRGQAGQSELAGMMVGRPMEDMFPPKPPIRDGQLALEVTDIDDGAYVRGVSLHVRPGEIVGLAGLLGSGRTELAEMIVGARPRAGGTILRNGNPVRCTNPKQAARAGIAYVSEDRKDSGLVLSMSVVENTTLANLDAYCRPLLNRTQEYAAAEHWKQTLDIRAHNLRAPILYLSGGNQQKVSVAKWLEVKPSVLILDEPTRGVDVGAKRELYLLISRLAQDGLACLVISSELPELLGLCHRILVMRHGKIAGEVKDEAMTEEAIMMLAAGVGAA